MHEKTIKILVIGYFPKNINHIKLNMQSLKKHVSSRKSKWAKKHLFILAFPLYSICNHL